MDIANGVLVMVVDGSKMLLFRNDGDEKYPVLTTVDHRTADNPQSSEHGVDTPGRTFSRVGDGRSSYAETDWHQQAEDRFASDAAVALEQALTENEGGAVIIAPPRTLGVLRANYGDATKERLLAEIGKDLTGHVTDDIVEAIRSHG